MKQAGIYLVIGGAILFIVVFISKIISFIVGNPLLGLALTAILIGLILILSAIYNERKSDPETVELDKIEK